MYFCNCCLFQLFRLFHFHCKFHSKCPHYVHKIFWEQQVFLVLFFLFFLLGGLDVSTFSSVGVGSSLSTTISDKSWVGHFFIVPGGEGPEVGGTSEVSPSLLGISWSITDVSLAFFNLHSPCGVGLGVLGLGASSGFH